MKKLVFLSLIIALSTGPSFAMYDFCESPADYNTFPQAYDVRTEYWKDIPNYNANDIKFGDMKNENPIFPSKFKSRTKKQSKSDQEKQ